LILKFLILIILTIILIALPFLWLLALIDVVKSEFKGQNKVVWIILIIFIPPAGTILYWLIGRKQKVK